MIGAMIMAVMFATLYLGFAQGYRIIGSARENLRATQILQEQMETIRLYTWEQITSDTNYIPTNFTSTNFSYSAGTQTTNAGLIYYGSISIDPTSMTESYSNDHRMVTVGLTWNSGRVQRQRQVSTMVSRYGLHNYYY